MKFCHFPTLPQQDGWLHQNPSPKQTLDPASPVERCKLCVSLTCKIVTTELSARRTFSPGPETWDETVFFGERFFGTLNNKKAGNSGQVTDIDMVYMQMYIYIIKYIFIYVIWCILKSTNSMAYRRNIDIVMYEWNFFFCVYANFIWHLGKYRGTYITK